MWKTKYVKEIRIGEVWDELESKKFPETITHKIFEITVVFAWNSAQRNKFNSVFQEFSASIKKISFWQGDWALGYHSMGFKQYRDIS